MSAQVYDCLVLGGGQAGLATGYYLRRKGLNFAIQGGGSDLAFPHHEFSAAHAEAALKVERMAGHYVHAGMIALSLYFYFSGHNAPGGGFAGGLVAARALILRYLAGGCAELEDRSSLRATRRGQSCAQRQRFAA